MHHLPSTAYMRVHGSHLLDCSFGRRRQQQMLWWLDHLRVSPACITCLYLEPSLRRCVRPCSGAHAFCQAALCCLHAAPAECPLGVVTHVQIPLVRVS